MTFVIRNDLQNTTYSGVLDSAAPQNLRASIYTATVSGGDMNIKMNRDTGSIFDSVDFDDIAINRGFISIDYF